MVRTTSRTSSSSPPPSPIPAPSIPPQNLKHSLLVLHFASYEAVLDEPGIGGSSRSCLHAKHGILPFSLGKRSLLVLRFASCEAVFDEPGIGGSSRSIRIFRPSGECAAVGRGRRKSRSDETSAVPGGASPFDANTCVAAPLQRRYAASSCATIACNSRSSPWPVTALTAITLPPICAARVSRIDSASGSSALLTTTISGRLPRRSS